MSSRINFFKPPLLPKEEKYHPTDLETYVSKKNKIICTLANTPNEMTQYLLNSPVLVPSIGLTNRSFCCFRKSQAQKKIEKVYEQLLNVDDSIFTQTISDQKPNQAITSQLTMAQKNLGHCLADLNNKTPQDKDRLDYALLKDRLEILLADVNSRLQLLMVIEIRADENYKKMSACIQTLDAKEWFFTISVEPLKEKLLDTCDYKLRSIGLAMPESVLTRSLQKTNLLKEIEFFISLSAFREKMVEVTRCLQSCQLGFSDDIHFERQTIAELGAKIEELRVKVSSFEKQSVIFKSENFKRIEVDFLEIKKTSDQRFLKSLVSRFEFSTIKKLKNLGDAIQKLNDATIKKEKIQNEIDFLIERAKVDKKDFPEYLKKAEALNTQTKVIEDFKQSARKSYEAALKDNKLEDEDWPNVLDAILRPKPKVHAE